MVNHSRGSETGITFPFIIVSTKVRRDIMKEVQTKPEGDQKIINESKENAGTFLRIYLCIKGFSIIDWVYHFTSKKKLKEK